MLKAVRLPAGGSRAVTWFFMALCVSAALSFAMAQSEPALAANMSEIRIGGDYGYLRVPSNKTYRWCAQSCKNDPRCKSWTYIKPTRQCRLKRIVAPALANKCCISGVKKKSARKTSREICADYANKALDQQDDNRARQCGYEGPSWNSTYKVHFRSCLAMSKKRRARLRAVRSRALKQCAKNRRKIDRTCHVFAKTARDIGLTAQKNRCQLKPRKWLGSYRTAYSWCQDNKATANQSALKEARKTLSACLAWGGGPYVKRCENYAKKALTQQDKARRNECGLSGDRWSSSFRDHYQWCMKVDPWDLRNENNVRSGELDRCLLQGGEGKEGKVACDHYARLAREQTRSNRKQNCGLKGRRWLADYDRHFAWCSKTSKINRDAEMKYREDALAKCFERGGGDFNEACDIYARRSVDQYKTNVEKKCDYRGRQWHDSYIRHYKWCVDAPSTRRSRRLKRRKDVLRGCRAPFRLPFGRR